MAQVEKSVKVDVPVQTAYNQWTQFEEFPRFMEGVEEVRQLDDSRLFWKADIGGAEKEWYARITEQKPDEVIAWQSEGGTPNAGEVRFQPTEDGKTEVWVRMEYEPEDMKEKVGDALGVVSRRVEGDLKRFKEFVESRGQETGAWRGEIHGGTTQTTGRYEQGGGMSGMSEDMPGTTESGREADAGRYGASGQGGSGYGGTPPASMA
jgi:uncharacterized membrane protein